ncbi:Ycf66 family protein [Cyanobium sp. FACHB-13342]|uniref:Ycf66 family protein n=1 Tax=Cyanobium sp. FACHB-13342 TaxID=2692793 RepID=UPI0016817A20|nr:Ycf66 family protein [Cyanobium sp. FACHB-13342]MBD2422321.1 hypothetical protein [Cyanobium sp. FACHB-13342]
MLATLGGLLALLLGLTILLLPLLASELSRPRDSAWGAVVLLLGLVLVTSADRLTGAPMLGVLSGGLLIGRLAAEVSQGRWRQLSPEEQQRLWSRERWQTSLQQAGATLAHLIAVVTTAGSGLGEWLAQRRQPKSSGKRWVRPEAPESSESSEPGEFPSEPSDPVVVSSFAEIDALIDAAPEPATPDPEAPTPEPQATSGQAG